MPPRQVSATLLEDLFHQERTHGRHVSSAIHRIMRQVHPDRFGDSPIEMVRMNLGTAVENALAEGLERKYPGRYIRMGELEFDGHYGHLDLFDTERMAVVEIKLTWASVRRAEDIEDEWFWRYWFQGRAYCKMLGVNTVVLMIVFLVGDWKQNSSPVGLEWEWTFSQDEIDETWATVKMYSHEEEGTEVRGGRSSKAARGKDGERTRHKRSNRR